MPVDLHVDLDGRLPTATEVTAYYVVAEGLTNVARTAHATRAGVTVARRDGGLVVEVRDDGVGGADPRAGSGITGSRTACAHSTAGSSLDSPRGSGTSIEVWLPCE